MPQATNNDGGDDGITPCSCSEPEPGPDDAPRECPGCGGYIMGAIIGGDVHPGYSSLGNGQAFYDAKEYWSLNTGSRGTVNSVDEYAYFRAFGDAEAVPPHDHWKARRLGTEAVSFDHVVGPDGKVETIVQNRRVEDLPDGPTYPVEVDGVPRS